MRQAMMRDKEIYDRKTLRPQLDKDAAGRFIRHSLRDLNNIPRDQDLPKPKNRKRKFDDVN